MSIVRYKRDELPPISTERLAQLRELAQRPDSEIDYSDIPPLTEEFWARAQPNPFCRPAQTTVHIDADVLLWLKREGQDWQKRMNQRLRESMLREQRAAATVAWQLRGDGGLQPATPAFPADPRTGILMPSPRLAPWPARPIGSGSRHLPQRQAPQDVPFCARSFTRAWQKMGCAEKRRPRKKAESKTLRPPGKELSGGLPLPPNSRARTQAHQSADHQRNGRVAPTLWPDC